MPKRLALPLQVSAGGGMVTVEQDSPADILQSVALLIATEPGDRRSVPDYGLRSMLGTGFQIDELAAAVTEWEERADPADVEIVLTDLVVEQQVTVYPSIPSPSSTEEA